MAAELARTRLRAAQYVRMSTEHQRYSIDNQKAVIADYAATNGYDIVATYADAGKSGLSLKGRDALKRLLADALAPERDFAAVLILDVSRWGRFQDPDQAGHYEFICRDAGLKIVYCAEPFENDQSAVSSIVKQLKRVMAAEYSRELSTRLTRARRQQAGLGFKQGGTLIYGFRRELRDQYGAVRCRLGPGERKMLSTDRVVIVPGPPEELAVIRRIFDLFVRRKLSANAIARTLRSEGVPGKDGAPWTHTRVRNLLKSEYCIGVYAYNRTSSFLQGPKTDNPESHWTRTATMDPIVPVETFQAAQRGLHTPRRKHYTKRRLLAALRRKLKQEGRLSLKSLGTENGMPSELAYRQYFGSVTAAFRLAGYVPPPWQDRIYDRKAWTPEEIATALRRAFDTHGYISNRTIEDDPALPSSAVVRRHFGTLVKAYTAAGLPVISPSERQAATYLRLRAGAEALPDRGRLRADGALLRPKFTSEQIVVGLRRLLAEKGRLATSLIVRDSRLPSATCIAHRFGSLTVAYAQAGWVSKRPKNSNTNSVEIAQDQTADHPRLPAQNSPLS